MKKRELIKVISCICCFSILITNTLSISPKADTIKESYSRNAKPKIKSKFIGSEIKSDSIDPMSNNDSDNVLTFVDTKNIDSDKDYVEKVIKEDVENRKFVIIYGNDIQDYNVSDITKLVGSDKEIEIKPKDDTAKALVNNLIAYSITKDANDSLKIGRFFNVNENANNKLKIEDKIDSIVKGAEHALTVKEDQVNNFINNDTFTTQAVNGSDTASFNESFDFGEYGALYTVTDFSRATGYGSINGTPASIWDVRQTTTSIPGWSWHPELPYDVWTTDYVYTRLSSENFYPTQQVLNYGPESTSRNSTAQVSLTWGAPSWSWSWESKDVTISNLSSPPQYGRWMFDFARGTSAAKNTYTVNPGVRVSNTSGNFVMDISNVVTYYEYMGGTSKDLYTGVWEYATPDR